MKVHHVGIACQDIEEAIENFKKFHLITWKSGIVTDALQHANLCIVKSDLGMDVEFISGEQVSKLLKKGISYYHICYEVISLDDVIEDFVRKGAIMVSEPKPAILFENRRVCFLYLPYGLVELLEK